jgi:hypothetical protein
MVWVNVAELALKFVLPWYHALIVCVPEVSQEAAKVATPPASVAVLPFMNETKPVGVPTAEETVAANVMDCPTVEGFGDEVSVTVVGAGFTI